MNAKTVFGVLLSLLMSASGLAASEATGDILRDLRKTDTAVVLRQGISNRVLLVSFLMKTWSVLGVEQGGEIRHCVAAVANDFCAIKMEIDYEHPPVFRSAGTRTYDYASDGSLVVWRSLRSFFICGYDRNQVREENVSFEVGTDNTIVRSNFHTLLYKYHIGNPQQSVYMMEQLFMATGRGFSRYLDELNLAKGQSDSEKLRAVEASGNFGGTFIGKWKMSQEKGADGLIRGAVFSRTDASPVVTTTNSGLIKCPGLTMAASGSFSYSRMYRAEFTILSLKQVDSDDSNFRNLCREVSEAMDAPLSPGKSEIVDYREEKPTRTSIK